MSVPVGWVLDPLYFEHEPGGHHPESSARLRAVERAVGKAPWADRLVRVPARDCDDSDVLRVHGQAHLERVLETSGTHDALDPDTRTSPASAAAARRALGGALSLVDAVLDGVVGRGFAALRPPGHHAGPGYAMGFCLFNNVAAAARYALDRRPADVGRVAVLDWDVHHGNGTQEIFQDDDRVLFFSSHRSPFYPFTGHADDVCDGRTLNAPLPGGFGDAALLYAWQALVAPAVARFEPDLILVSAGYDAHAADPMGGCSVTDDGFARLAAFVQSLADRHCRGRWIAALEGGYDLAATARSTARTLEVMLGEPAPPPTPGGAGDPAAADALVRGIVARTRAAARRTAFGRTVDWKASDVAGG